jgi:hypothetical protein
MIVVGFDPGGKNAFGWAIVSGTLDAPNFESGGVATGAQQALECSSTALKFMTDAPDAIAIDAPLHWSGGVDRAVDCTVRRQVCDAHGRSGTVSHVNSLRGACLVEGVVIAKLSHEAWPSARLTEAHPKALMLLCSEAKLFSALPSMGGSGHHMRDAAVCAFAGLAMLEDRNGWRDLVVTESGALFPFGIKAEYWFPQG